MERDTAWGNGISICLLIKARDPDQRQVRNSEWDFWQVWEGFEGLSLVSLGARGWEGASGRFSWRVGFALPWFMVRRASLQRKVGPSTPKRGQPLASATYDCLFFGCLEDGVHLGNMNLDREGNEITRISINELLVGSDFISWSLTCPWADPSTWFVVLRHQPCAVLGSEDHCSINIMREGSKRKGLLWEMTKNESQVSQKHVTPVFNPLSLSQDL